MPEPTSSAASLLTPDVLQTVAEAIAMAMANPQPAQLSTQPPVADEAPATKPDNPIMSAQPVAAQVAAELGNIVAPMAAPLLARAESRLASRKLWVAAGTILALAAQSPLGLALHQAAQDSIAALAAVYVAAQAIVDGARKGGGNG